MRCWSPGPTTSPGSVELPERPLQVFDHLGRGATGWSHLKLTAAPVFALLPSGSAKTLSLIAPPAAPTRQPGTNCPVLYASPLAGRTSGFETICLSRLHPQPTDHSRLRVQFRVLTRSRMEVPTRTARLLERRFCFDRQPCAAATNRLDSNPVFSRPWGSSLPLTVRVVGDFGNDGQPLLSFRIVPEN